MDGNQRIRLVHLLPNLSGEAEHPVVEQLQRNRAWQFGQTKKPSIPVVEQLQKAFGTRFEEVMTQLVLGTLPSSAVFTDPLTPVTFSVDGIDYVWQPGVVPLKLNDGPR